MLRFIDDEESVTIRMRPNETHDEFLKRIRTWLIVREQQRRKDRKAARHEVE